MEKEKDAVLTLRHEELLSSPGKVISETAAFLGLPVFEEYLKACCSIVWPSPQLSRQRIDSWDEKSLRFIQDQIDRYAFFNGYTFQ